VKGAGRSTLYLLDLLPVVVDPDAQRVSRVDPGIDQRELNVMLGVSLGTRGGRISGEELLQCALEMTDKGPRRRDSHGQPLSTGPLRSGREGRAQRGQQTARLDAQRDGDAEDVDDGHIPFAALDAPDVGSVKAGDSGKPLLR